MQPLATFLSYSHDNHKQRKKLRLYLSELEREGLIRLWDDRELRVGQFVDESILAKLDESQVFILLVSQEFLASEYCSSIEMTRALERHAAGTALVFPIILAPCDWVHSPLAKLVVSPTDGKPIAQWKPQGAGWADVARLMREAVARFRERQVAVEPLLKGEGGDYFPPLPLPPQSPPAPRFPPVQVAGLVAGGAAVLIAGAIAVTQSMAGWAIGYLWNREEEAPLPPAPMEVAPPLPAQALPVAELKLIGLPAGVTVTIDGHPVKDPWAELYLEAGSHEVAVLASGVIWRADVELTAGEKRTLQMVKSAPKGYIEVHCQPWCEIEVDGLKTGRTSPAKLGLSHGPHRLRLTNPVLGLAENLDVVVEADASLHLAVDLKE